MSDCINWAMGIISNWMSDWTMGSDWMSDCDIN